jgi:hypothetical protein
VIGVILFPYVGVLTYVISQGKSMTARSVERVQQARAELRNVVGFSVADEIEKLDRLSAPARSQMMNSDVFRAKLVKAA